VITCPQCIGTKVRVTFNGTIDCPNCGGAGHVPAEVVA
jgi:uncharacterized Zn finger protein (UPF0148 family)